MILVTRSYRKGLIDVPDTREIFETLEDIVTPHMLKSLEIEKVTQKF